MTDSYEAPRAVPATRHEAVFAEACDGEDGHAYLVVGGVEVRAYLADGMVNVDIDLIGGENPEAMYAVHVQQSPNRIWSQRAGVPRLLLAEPTRESL
jgi:hypothetical protein